LRRRDVDDRVHREAGQPELLQRADQHRRPDDRARGLIALEALRLAAEHGERRHQRRRRTAHLRGHARHLGDEDRAPHARHGCGASVTRVTLTLPSSVVTTPAFAACADASEESRVTRAIRTAAGRRRFDIMTALRAAKPRSWGRYRAETGHMIDYRQSRVNRFIWAMVEPPADNAGPCCPRPTRA